MANPWSGEVAISVNGTERVMKLTLGALAELEGRIEAGSLVDLISRFETGTYRSLDLMALITAALRGGGLPITETEVANASFDGGLNGAASAAARCLALAFAPPESVE